MSRSFLVVPLAALLAGGCTDRSPTALPADFRVGSPAAAPSITVMTQNLYVGADVDLVIGALASLDPADDFPALLFAIQTLGNTDFPSRAGAIADEIARRRPHAVGLQEVSVIDIDLRALGLPIVVNLDFLEILHAELTERGLPYTLAAQVENIVAEPFPGISLVDHDALLVDGDRVEVTAAGGQNFAFNVGVVAPGIELKRGWVWADAVVDGNPYRFVNTHAEADLGGAHLDELRAAQLSELVASLPTDRPVVVMGDLNDIPGSLMYQVLAGAGFTDAWAALRPGVIGYTCCQAADLSNALPDLDERIDYVLARGIGVRGRIDRFGDVPADRTAGAAYPIWPSDHVGLIAMLGVRP